MQTLLIRIALGLGLAASLHAQVATQVVLSNPNSGDGSGYTVDTTGRHQNVNNLSRSVTHLGNVAEATNTTSWDINPAGGYIQFSSTSAYTGWVGSGVTLDTRYGMANFDTFTVNAGNSGFANGDAVKVNLALTLQASASTDGLKFETASNNMAFSVQRRDPVPGYLGNTYAEEIFSMDFNVTVYEFVEKAVINGVVDFDNTVTYVNGQGNELRNYAFDIELDAVVGETLELGLLVGGFNPNVYDYDISNFVSGTRQDIGNSQVDYGNTMAATFSWDIEHAAGFGGLDVLAASGFAPSASAVPEPGSFAIIAGFLAIGFAGGRRRRAQDSQSD